ncbi:hypothetical protein [Massilia sp. AB1]|uniref:hypothetical protein n=1 Tax=Massilia sp. AB1 TaxID=2823371 RepID=UPI001B81EC16|nr:hypothetical protein [Massilia sp. AB1]MBQ5938583.1 hypothetical protein [Massilia sp. AB1]
MLILAAIQSLIAVAFLLFGFVALFGIGITGLLFLVPGVIFAVTAGLALEKSRGAAVIALVADAALAYMAIRKLQALLAPAVGESEAHQAVRAVVHPNMFDYLVPSAVLVLVGIGVIALLMDWRTLRHARWF